MDRFHNPAVQAIERCRSLAQFTVEPGFNTRPFLCEPMHQVHTQLGAWMEQAGLQVRIDAAGNLRGCRNPAQPRFYIGSHLDTVPRAGAFDGVLGVVMGLALAESLESRHLPFDIEIIGFSEEEGVRFGMPFIGSRAFAGDRVAELLDARDPHGISVANAIRDFGLNPACLDTAQAEATALGYLEFHIEQGPVLDSLDLPVAVVDSIAGQSRMSLTFLGQANHAGTTPIDQRRDAVACAAEWIGAVERLAISTPALVATVGSLEALPGAGNVIAGQARASLDVRHPQDAVRRRAVDQLLASAEEIAARRGLAVSLGAPFDQPTVLMDGNLVRTLEQAAESCRIPVHHMSSGAGHDAMIVAKRMPAAMLFLRSPGGISHQPGETVLAEDVAAALETGCAFLDRLAKSYA
ncbi:MAG: allantoate amidohydrolase [Bryobacteraceae bacterium]|jgi:allantoate deiminase